MKIVTPQDNPAAREQGAVSAYGNFITVLINFLILAWIIFLMVKAVNRVRASIEKEKAPAPAAPPPQDILLLSEIRDLLRRRA
ncbi:Large-conductance mechanosensitive channel [Ensifer psoraleae]|nr:Large-conductance mechanosensitive channel [Sinorhizobium psoraleae]